MFNFRLVSWLCLVVLLVVLLLNWVSLMLFCISWWLVCCWGCWIGWSGSFCVFCWVMLFVNVLSICCWCCRVLWCWFRFGVILWLCSVRWWFVVFGWMWFCWLFNVCLLC